jgi:prepilin-type processing-associated H-X9-DG protein
MDHLAGLSALKQFDPDYRELLGTLADRMVAMSGQFKKAGGKTIWAVGGIDAEDPLPTVRLIVPLSPGSDAEALSRLLSDGNVMEVEREKDALIARPRGSSHVRPSPNPRPDLAAELAAVENTPLGIAIAPPADGRRVLESMLPPLPGGQPATVLTRGILRASIAIDLPPEAVAHLILRSEDNASAQALEQLITSLAPMAPAEPHKWDTVADFSLRAAAALAGELSRNSKVVNNQVMIDLGPETVGELTASLLVDYELGLRVKSGYNMKDIVLACVLYANNRKDLQFPGSLQEATKSRDLPPSVLINPRLPGKQPGYIYIPPREGEPVSGDRMMIYENFDRFAPGINIGFADGHIEWYASEQEFNKLLQTAKAGERK